jgi:hypothetical protein
VGFIKWPQIYAAEVEKLKGGIFNDRKCIKMFCQYHPNRCGQKIVLSRNSLQKSQKRTF